MLKKHRAFTKLREQKCLGFIHYYLLYVEFKHKQVFTKAHLKEIYWLNTIKHALKTLFKNKE